MQDPNFVYFLALFIWPLVAVRFFSKYSAQTAVALSFLTAYLFLPVPLLHETPLDLPFLPPLDKNFIPAFTVFSICWFKKIKLDFFPREKWSGYFAFAFLSFPFLTMINNGSPLWTGNAYLPGLSFKDSISILMDYLFSMYLPFVIGYSLLRTSQAHEKFVVVLFGLGLFYAVLMLWEVRMSPQLHTQIYGYFPHDWGQQKRAGGFRPVVFLGHGLFVALFACVVVLSAYILWREKHKVLKSKSAAAFLFLCVVLVLCKTYSAMIYFLFFISVSVFIKSTKLRLTIASGVAAAVLAYPAIRDQVPLVDVASFFEGISPERAQSLQFRFDHEDRLLEKAMEKRWFGWGTWSRNRIYDPWTGEDLSVTDGAWIIQFGQFGWYGYVGFFGLLVYPILRLRSVEAKHKGAVSNYTYGLVMIVVIILIDQIPNASVNSIYLLIAGALLGRSKAISLDMREKSV